MKDYCRLIQKFVQVRFPRGKHALVVSMTIESANPAQAFGKPNHKGGTQ